MKEVKGKTLHSAPSVASVIISCFLAKRLYTGALRGLTFTGAALTLSVPSVLTAVSVMHALCGRSLLLGGRGVGGSRKAGGVLRSTTGARCHFLCVTCCCGWGSLVGRENGGGGILWMSGPLLKTAALCPMASAPLPALTGFTFIPDSEVWRVPLHDF